MSKRLQGPDWREFEGLIEIRSDPENPLPQHAVVVDVKFNCTATADGLGIALGMAVKAYLESYPLEERGTLLLKVATALSRAVARSVTLPRGKPN